MRVQLALVVLISALAIAPAQADTISLNPSKDNTIFEEAEFPAVFSDGQGEQLYIGRTGDRNVGLVRRTLMAFNVAAALPANAIITNASLSLTVGKSGSAGDIEFVTLSRLAADWGEDASFSFGGAGGTATGLDATWSHRFFNAPNSAWTNLGGDFADTASASGTLGKTGSFAISDPRLASDVQDWHVHPGDNFGWIIEGDENTLNSAKQIDSRESGSPPVLTITYSVPDPGSGLSVIFLLAFIPDTRRRRRATNAGRRLKA